MMRYDSRTEKIDQKFSTDRDDTSNLDEMRLLLAQNILQSLIEKNLTTIKAEKLTGFSASDFSRIRQNRLSRFTIDRLMVILERLGKKVKINIEDGVPV